jgi:hypothetical protein
MPKCFLSNTKKSCSGIDHGGENLSPFLFLSEAGNMRRQDGSLETLLTCILRQTWLTTKKEPQRMPGFLIERRRELAAIALRQRILVA